MTTPVLTLDAVHRSFMLGSAKVHALRGVDLSIQAGTFTTLMGPSGSGKSTLLQIAGGLDFPDQGECRVNGHSWAGLGEREASRRRNREVGFIFQSFNLVDVLTVYENIELPLLMDPRLTRAERARRVQQGADQVGLGARLRHRPESLSGGERQRVAIARALAPRPKLVLADEPTANLDSETADRVITLMQALSRGQQVAFFLATHDARLMARADQGLRIVDGQLAAA